MTYYDYITQFKGIEHPYGDLAADLEGEVKSSENPDTMLGILEGKSFSDIYEHLVDSSVSVKCMDTFVESWASYLQHEKKAISDPIPALILYQLSRLNKGMEYLGCLNGIYSGINVICRRLGEISETLEDFSGDTPIQICGAVDTYEQNDICITTGPGF